MFRTKLILLIIILPLVIALMGGWQAWRAENTARPLLTRLDAIEKGIAQVENARKDAGKEAVTLRLRDGKTITAAEGLRRLHANKARAEETLFWRRTVVLPFSVGAIFSGVVAFGMGVFGLVTVRQAGARALHSREALLQGFQRGLARLPWVIGAIGFFIATGLAFLIAFELARYIGVGGRLSGKLIIMGIIASILLLFFGFKLVRNVYRASKAVFERDPMRLMGKYVSSVDAPKVWEFVRKIAVKAGATMPDAIILGLDEGFFVTEHPVALLSGETVPEGRVLYLPLPYMAYMTEGEAAAVIGHELGHFTGEDTEYSLRFSPIYATAVINLRAVAMAADADDGLGELVAKPALMFGEYYLDSFDLAVQHWSREREFAADKMGASIAGSDAVALSLLRISVLAPHVYSALAECWARGGNLQGGVVNRVRELVREHGLADPAELLEERQAHPTDSHPATRQRLEAVGVAVTEELTARARCVEESSLLLDLGLEEDEPAASEEPGKESGEQGSISSGWAALRKSALSAALESEFSNAARENAGEWEKDMQEAASLGTDRIHLYESVTFMVAICVFALLAGVGIGAGLLLEGSSWGWLIIVLGVACVYPITRMMQRRKIPFLTLTETGFSRDADTEEIPWSRISDYGISIASTSGFNSGITITFEIAEGYEPETKRTVRSRYKGGYRQLSITVSVVAKPYRKAEVLNEELFNHWHGGNVRKILKDREE